MRIKGSFTAVAVRGLIQMVPFSNRADPDIQSLMELMRGADITLANNENVVVDRLTFRGPISHMESLASVAEDWANMGIGMVTKANNHTWDNGDPGLLQNLKELQRVGIDYVGTDYSLTEARLARFRAISKGKSGLPEPMPKSKTTLSSSAYRPATRSLLRQYSSSSCKTCATPSLSGVTKSPMGSASRKTTPKGWCWSSAASSNSLVWMKIQTKR